MRTISADRIRDTVAELCVRANRQLPEDIVKAIESAGQDESWPTAKYTLDILQENMALAKERELPVCQDTGMACVFLELGQDVHVEGDINEAIHEGVRRGYEEGYLRKSIVADPLRRGNTGDNTPAAITVHLVPGDGLKITVAPKGFGSENMSRLAMLKPADGVEGVKNFVYETVKIAGPNPCPPIVLGIGIGGSFDKQSGGPCQTGAAPSAGRAKSRPVLCRTGTGTVGGHQRSGDRPPGIRRKDHGTGRFHRDDGHPCGRTSGGSQCQLPRDTPRIGRTVREELWNIV